MDKSAKRAQIEAIDNEVDDLHPLLHEILEKINGVTYVEYTHGTKEMGADFVVERLDRGIGDTHHIGIVAKTEKILQNFGEVERQIDECNIRRYIRQGKQEIRLQEIWVITSKSVSQNAKDKIWDKYPAKRISFFDSDWLVNQVDDHAEYYWHQLPTAIGAYLNSVSKSMGQLDAQTSLLNVPGATEKYIDLDVEAISTGEYKSKKSFAKARTVNFKEEVLGHRLTLLEADMGFGKSRLARKIVSDLTHPETFKDSNTIPVYAPFSEFVKKDFTSIDSYLKDQVGESGLEHARSSGLKFLLVLDGLDEGISDQERRENKIKALIAEVNSVNYVQLLLTSRPYKLLEELPDLAVARRYRIRPLSMTKLIQFVEEVCASMHLPSRLYQDLAKSDLFKQLPQNPIAAALLSNLLSQNSQDLPSNLTELYAKSMDHMLGRWDEKKSGLSTEKIYKTCERVARDLARYMLDNELVYISKDEARDKIRLILSERNLIGISEDQITQYVFERTHLFGVLEDTGTIFFRHRSLAEFLYALDAFHVRNLRIEEKAFEPAWSNVCFFYIGLLAECPDLLRQIVSLQPSNERSKWVRFLHLGNYLLAGYQSVYAVVEESLSVSFADIAQLYIDVRNGKTQTRLTDLSEMQLMWLFAACAKHAYGYQFFLKALPLAMVQIEDDMHLDEERKNYGLFFAACVLGELGDKCGFRFLLERRKTEALPLPISMALDCETGLLGKHFCNDPLVKAHDKKLKKLLFARSEDKLFQQQKLEALWETPLSTKIKNAGRMLTRSHEK